jgi:hypothetical protein
MVSPAFKINASASLASMVVYSESCDLRLERVITAHTKQGVHYNQHTAVPGWTVCSCSCCDDKRSARAAKAVAVSSAHAACSRVVEWSCQKFLALF